ncbi:hypothetical protein ABVT39_010494 [Epinephelus coioides]
MSSYLSAIQVKKKQAPAAAEETETSPVHQMFHEETNTQVKALQTPAAAEETETSPVHQMFHEESKPDETNTQVKALQTPAAAEEMETSPVHQMFHEESKPDETNTQVKALQTPAAAEETETSPVHQMFHEESKPDVTNTQVKALQTPAAAEETETSPVHQMFHEESKPDETNTQVKALQTPAAAEETETSPVHQIFHEESKPDETNTQVKALQTPAAAEETETSPVHQMFHEESKPDETNTQVFTVQGFSLIDYPDSDETDEDCMENESLTPHPDVVLRQNTENIMNDIGPDVSDHLYDDETVVKETCDEASQNNHSNEQSDDELVPPLRRTKSILMDRVQDFTHCLYDSSSDSAEDTFNLKPERDSQRLRRSSRCPIRIQNLMESDDSNVGSEDEYVPHPMDESTESDSSLELTLQDEKKNKGVSSSQSKFKPRESGSESSRQRRSKSSSQSKSKPRESGKTIDTEGPLQEDIEDVSMPGEEGSEDVVSMSSRHGCTSTLQIQNQEVSADVSMPGEEGSEDEASMSSLQECTSTSQVQNRSVSAKKRGKQSAVKRSWTPDECAAVDRHLRKFIVRNQVPGKEACQRCITAELQALRNRDWKAVKYYIKNRISALRRKV